MSAPRRPAQFDLFTGALEEAPVSSRRRTQPVAPAPVSDALRALGERLPQGVFLGTSSWTFPGWTGLVYDHEATTTQLAREGLGAYAHHPVLRTVGIDRTFYAPVPAAAFADYAQQVPDGFRFLVKAHEACTLARFVSPGKPIDRVLRVLEKVGTALLRKTICHSRTPAS